MMILTKELGEWRAQLRPRSNDAGGALLQVWKNGTLLAVNAWAEKDHEDAQKYFALIQLGINAAERVRLAGEGESGSEASERGDDYARRPVISTCDGPATG